MDVIIETPRGSCEKYKYDEKKRFFRLKKILPAGFVFPYAFGFIPGTKGEDGDPLDVLIISELNGYPGCIVDCRIIGSIKAKQSEKNKKVRNDRYLAVAEKSHVFKDVKSVKDLPAGVLEQLQSFFVHYIEPEDKELTVLDIADAEEAREMIEK
jgi:inorganic pyrophosphatase